METNLVKSTRELRKFGLVMTGAFSVLGGLLVWRGRSAGPYVLSLAGFFLIAGLLFPRLLGPIERAWMAFGRRMSVVMTFVVLTLSFYLVITPFGLLLRLLGKELLDLKFNSGLKSYWVPVEPDGPSSRPDRPY
jgi:hypothetical protein